MLRKLWLNSSSSQLEAAERALISTAQVTYEKARSSLGVNYLRSHSDQRREGAPTVVLLHGYGAGSALFYRNMAFLDRWGADWLAVDFLGMGGSLRPKTQNARIYKMAFCESKFKSSRDVIGFFLDPLHHLLEELKLKEYSVMAHSLGGYLAAKYQQYYKTGIRSLLLASPVGLLESGGGIDTSGSSLLRLLDIAWSRNVTPQLLRAMGPRARRAVDSAVAARFPPGSFSASEARLFAEYLYHISVAPASGEFALNSILQSGVHRGSNKMGVFAKDPIDIPTLASTDTTVVFGDHDWMFEPSVVPALRGSAQLQIVPEAGHHLYMDNAPIFNSIMKDKLF